jgi:hypothetical protein
MNNGNEAKVVTSGDFIMEQKHVFPLVCYQWRDREDTEMNRKLNNAYQKR